MKLLFKQDGLSLAMVMIMSLVFMIIGLSVTQMSVNSFKYQKNTSYELYVNNSVLTVSLALQSTSTCMANILDANPNLPLTFNPNLNPQTFPVQKIGYLNPMGGNINSYIISQNDKLPSGLIVNKLYFQIKAPNISTSIYYFAELNIEYKTSEEFYGVKFNRQIPIFLETLADPTNPSNRRITNCFASYLTDVNSLKSLCETTMNGVWSATKFQCDLIPVGSVSYFASNAIPRDNNGYIGWLVADGHQERITDYPRLFAVIGNKYGGAPPFFRMPDLRNQFIRGVNNLGNTGAGTIGTTELSMSNIDVNTVTISGLDHFHSVKDNGHSHSLYDGRHKHTVDGDFSDPSQWSHGTTECGNAGQPGGGTTGPAKTDVQMSANTVGISVDNGLVNTTITGGAETRPNNISLLPFIKY